MKLEKPELAKLKELYKIQCDPCIKCYPECKGNKKDAKAWKCAEFYSGLFFGTA